MLQNQTSGKSISDTEILILVQFLYVTNVFLSMPFQNAKLSKLKDSKWCNNMFTWGTHKVNCLKMKSDMTISDVASRDETKRPLAEINGNSLKGGNQRGIANGIRINFASKG